ncbi:hypothetical protein HG531_012748 [Fusarium graminearum]|nr:hypothetical protein HG531_012748 [Fusarium graminearum]
MFPCSPSRRVETCNICPSFNQKLCHAESAVDSSDMKGGPGVSTLCSLKVYFLILGSLEDDLGAFDMPEPSGNMKRSLASLVLPVDINASFYQELHNDAVV